MAIKNFGSYRFDYYDYCLKDAYENADDDIKQVFNPSEKYTDEGMFEYRLNANTSGLSGIANVVNKFVKLRDSAGKHYNYMWKVNVSADGFEDIMLAFGMFEDEVSLCRREQCEYVIYCVDSGKTEKLTEEEITRYYKPYSLKVFLNGEIVMAKNTSIPIQQNVQYDYASEEYELPVECLDGIDGVEIQYNKYGVPNTIKYKDTLYKVDRGMEQKLEKNILPRMVRISTLEKIMDVKFEINYKEETINIVQ